MTFSAEQSLGSLVTDDYRIAAVLEQHNIDFYCGGQRSLAAACEDNNCSAESVLQEINALSAKNANDDNHIDWDKISLSDLVDHIQNTHHLYIQNEVPRLLDLVHKVTAVHCLNHPELVDIKITFDDLCAELAGHMQKEEQVLFPLVKELDNTQSGQALNFHCGSVHNPIRVMEAEHDNANKALALIRELSDNYSIPSDSCNSYSMMLHGLEAFEKDLHRHVHKENNILFPKVCATEQRLIGNETH